MLEQGIIAPSDTSCTSPIVLVNNPTDTGVPKRRLCLDFRKLNEHVVKDPIQQPSCEEVLDGLAGAKYITSVDLSKGYFQIGLDPATAEKTGFVTHRGKFVFKRLPFGLCTSQSAFLRVIDKVIPQKESHGISNYVDDILVKGSTFQEMLNNLEYLLQCLASAGLTTKLEKAKFAMQEMTIFGFRLTSDGITPDPGKTSAIADAKRPRTVRQVKSFLGLCSFYRKFIKDFSKIASPLVYLTKQSFKWRWGEEQEHAFQLLKTALNTAPILALPTIEGEFDLSTDASANAIGAVLHQHQNGALRTIAYASKLLQGAQLRYSVTDKEALAIVWSVQKFRPYLDSRPFTLRTDHKALLALKTANLDSKLIRWGLILQNYDYKVQHVPGARNAVADFLSRPDLTTDEMQSSPDEAQDGHKPDTRDVTSAVLQATGEDAYASNSSKRPDQSDRHPLQQTRREGKVPTLYPAVPGVTGCNEVSVARDTLQKDSMHTYQYTGPTPVQDRGEPMCCLTQPTTPKAAQTLPIVPPADAAPAPASDPQQPSPDHDPHQKELIRLQQSDDETGPLYRFLLNGEKPATTAHRTMKAKTRRYSIRHGILVKNNKGVFKTAVPLVLRRTVLETCHDHISAGHFGIKRTLERAQRQHTWPGMHKDVKNYVKGCLTCQQYKHSQKAPSGMMLKRQLSGVWETCFTDICGPFPISKSGNAYLVVFQDQFSKVVEIAAIKRANAKHVARAFINLVYSRHGCPRYMCSDNGQPFVSKVLASIYQLLGARQHHTLPYRPQANASERAIRDVSRVIASYAAGEHNRWDACIPQISLAINTSMQFSTRYAPYYLLYGRDIRLPALSDDHLSAETSLTHEEYAEELRATLQRAYSCVARYSRQAQDRQKRAYDKHRGTTTFDVSDYVWITSHVQSDAAAGISKKLSPKRRGPFQIIKRCSDLIYVLRDPESGKEMKAHADQLQIFFSNDDFPRPTEPLINTVPSGRSTPDSESDGDDQLACSLPQCDNPDAVEWIFCDLCDKPAHTACIGVTLEEAKLMDYVCSRCRATACQ